VQRAVTVLVIACPHALGLAVPLVVAASTSLAARNGVLVRDRAALESSRSIDTVLFDKTGTLTVGEHRVTEVRTADGLESRALGLMAAAESDSEHPIAEAVREEATARGIEPPVSTGFRAMEGRGVRAEVDGREVHVGGPALLEELGVSAPEELAAGDGGTEVYLVEDREVTASATLADEVKGSSREAVSRLQEMGKEVSMITGDSEEVARTVAEELGIDRYFAGVLPEDKDSRVRQLQEEGRRVMMVGDGVNDAPALARADVGVAIGSGTDVAVESAGIVLIQDDPLDIVQLLELSDATYSKTVQNLFWAAGYNVVAIPLAAGVLAPWGFTLSPAVGALLMSASTVIVAVNARLLSI
jgi:Cu2+-exporting ATPase